MTKPVKVAFEGDESDLVRSLDKAGAGLDDFAADAASAGAKAESSLAGVGDKADAVGSATSQAAGGLGDLGGALALMPGPLGAVGGGMEALAPAVMGVTGAADLLNLATTKFPALAKAQAVATNVVAGAQRALNAVMAGNPIALVVLAIVALIAIFAVLYQKNEGFRELVNKVFGALKDRVSEAVEKVGAFAGTVKDKLSNAGARFSDLRDAAGNAIGSYNAGSGGVLGKVYNIVEAVTSLPGTIRTKAAGVFGPVKDAADGAIGSYSDDGGGVLGKLHKIVSTITGLGGTITTKAANMWDGLGSSFKGVINRMIGWWNNLSFSIDIPDKIPGLPDSFSITTPNIPYLAEGGLITSATLAVVGEAGPEVVIPLDRLREFGGGGGTYVRIDVTVAPTASPEETGRQVQRALDAYYRVGGRAAA
jgi:phage-related protein